MDDASLDEFLDDSGDGSEETDDATENGDATETDDAAENNDTAAEDSAEGQADDADMPNPVGEETEPASATSRWEPGGVACQECATTVERLWRDEGWVCRECKEW